LYLDFVRDRDERLRTMETELTSQIDELSTVVQQKVAFNDTSKSFMTWCCVIMMLAAV